jgi:hypothetical protein
MKWQWRAMGGGGGIRWIRWWWWWGSAFANARWERGLGSKSDKTEHDGSISGAPRETAVEGNGGRWWHGVDEVVVVVRLRVRKPKAGEGLGAKTTKPSHCDSVLGCF